VGVDVIFPDEEEEVIDQSEKVKEETAKRMSEMGWLFDNVHKKLGTDNICFECKKKLKMGSEVRILIVSKSEPGTVIFVSICKSCSNKFEDEQKKNKKDSEEKK